MDSFINNKLNYKFYLILAMCAGLIKGVAIAYFGAFQDSYIYFQMYERVNEVGVLKTIAEFSSQTLKFEPVLLFLYGILEVLTIDELGEYYFIIINLIFINLIINASMHKYFLIRSIKKINVLSAAIVVPLGYLFFSKDLYFWRSVLALAFFINFIKSSGIQRLVFGALAIGSHFSFIFFLPLYLIAEYVSLVNKRWVYILFNISPAILYIALLIFPDLISFIVSGGDSAVYTTQGGDHTIKVWLSILFSFFILILVYDEFMSDEVIRPIFLFCFVIVCVGLLSYNSYHLMNRIFLPASILVGYFPFLMMRNNFKSLAAKFMMIVTIIPSFRLIYMLFSGDFNPI